MVSKMSSSSSQNEVGEWRRRAGIRRDSTESDGYHFTHLDFHAHTIESYQDEK